MGHGYRWIGMSDDREVVTLKRFKGEFHCAPRQEDLFSASNENARLGVVLDVETTGMSSANDHVIEVGIRKFSYDATTGEILERLDGYGELQDPGIAIPKEITGITGITDEMVKGHAIDWDKVNGFIGESSLILAHNASFDRPFIEKHCASARTGNWGCTFKQIDWSGKGFPTSKLEILSIFHGFFVDAHRALEDSDALLHLLTHKCPQSDRFYLKELLVSADSKWFRVMAKRAAFEKKDVLKSRRYRWDGNQKFWYRDIVETDLDPEKSWLSENVYSGGFLGDIAELSASQRFRD